MAAVGGRVGYNRIGCMVPLGDFYQNMFDSQVHGMAVEEMSQESEESRLFLKSGDYRYNLSSCTTSPYASFCLPFPSFNFFLFKGM